MDLLSRIDGFGVVGIVVLGAEILGIISAVSAIMSVRTSQGAVAWVVSLITFPWVAVPAYWVFGRNRFHGYVNAYRVADLRAAVAIAQAEASARGFLLDPMARPAVARAAERLARIPFLRGNSVTLLVDGHETFESIIDGIRQAREYVLLQFFIIKDDGIGRRLQQALIERAQAGVQVHVLYDEVGSHALSKKYTAELREAGVEVYNFHTRQGPWNRFQINFRNHRKIVVVDGCTAWIGGHNVGDEYLGGSERFGRWRDTHVRIDGPAAVAAQLSFVEDWNWATGSPPDVDWDPDPSEGGGDASVLVIPSGPADPLDTAALMFTHAINTAQHRLWITSPYFVPDEGVMAALQLAAMRGVDVRILIPDRPDHLLVYVTAFTYFDEALEAGVAFYRYTAGFLHQKVILVDDAVAAVGTANFDNRSFRLNFEVTAVVADSDFVRAVDDMLRKDFANARQVDRSEFGSRPFWFKLAARSARLLAPIQ